MRTPGDILLLSSYELGHSPQHLAAPLAFFERAGYAPRAIDLSLDALDEDAVRAAALVCIAVQMHTALRLGIAVAKKVRALAPTAKICFFGLYAPLYADALHAEGLADRCLGGEHEEALVAYAEELDSGRTGADGVTLERLLFPTPRRDSLPLVSRYAHLVTSDGNRHAGYVEASRGCLHTCRHCPIPAVYDGRFFIMPIDTVLADIDAQVAAGARHITFGDPDFWNGPRHGMALVRRLAARHPGVSFDVTIKVEHLLRHAGDLAELQALGCAFVVSAFESRSERVLSILDKGHTRADLDRALDLTDRVGLPIRPTFVPFTPWTTLADYADLLDWIGARDLEGRVDPIQLAVRLLVPPGSLLLRIPEGAVFGALDPERLTHVWTHADARMEGLEAQVFSRVEQAGHESATETFAALRDIVASIEGTTAKRFVPVRTAAPRLSEPWFCCAEPSARQLGALAPKV
ncbi:MAG: CUAEP/CCAEP-tail radical SAM protein [Polyangia bacterium]